MNKERRAEIRNIMYAVENIKTRISDVLDDEQFAYDNMPENLQYSERGEKSQEAIEALESAISSIDDLIDSMEEAAI